MSSRILLIEDEARIADFLVRGLTEEGYQLERVSDGREGWRALEDGKWDLVLLDWWLPGEDGIELLQRLRKNDRTTPVIMLTARDSVPDRVAGLDAGADDYVFKPFSFEELLARIRAQLRRSSHATGQTLEYQDIRADLRTQRASRGGNVLDLTAKEYSLLLCFLRHPGTVLSHTQLYETVWGDPYDHRSNTLEVHINKLRRKLEQFGPRVVRTRRGRGYALEGHQPQEA